jgi:hypothetical protein
MRPSPDLDIVSCEALIPSLLVPSAVLFVEFPLLCQGLESAPSLSLGSMNPFLGGSANAFSLTRMVTYPPLSHDVPPSPPIRSLSSWEKE